MSSAVLPPQQIESHIEPGTRRKYSFTPAMDEEIRRAYHLYVEYNSRKSIGACARRLGLPRWMVTRRGALLGVARVKEPVWSPEEVALLERWGHLTDAVIQRKLKSAGYQRSVNAIHLKLKRLRIKQNLDGYSAYSLATAFGVNPHKITNWVRRGMREPRIVGRSVPSDREGTPSGSPTRRYGSSPWPTRMKLICGRWRSGGSLT